MGKRPCAYSFCAEQKGESTKGLFFKKKSSCYQTKTAHYTETKLNCKMKIEHAAYQKKRVIFNLLKLEQDNMDASTKRPQCSS